MDQMLIMHQTVNQYHINNYHNIFSCLILMICFKLDIQIYSLNADGVWKTCLSFCEINETVYPQALLDQVMTHELLLIISKQAHV